MDFYWVYVLELVDNKFYVGISKDCKKRFEEHRRGEGSDFTRKFKPLYIVDKRNTQLLNKKEAEHIENIVTIQWMILKGVENVRGGNFCALENYDLINKIDTDVLEKIRINSNKHNLNKSAAYSKAEKIYNNSSYKKRKDISIEKQIKERNIKKGGAWCKVAMCIHNYRGKCSLGLSPWDKNLCEKNYSTR